MEGGAVVVVVVEGCGGRMNSKGDDGRVCSSGRGSKGSGQRRRAL